MIRGKRLFRCPRCKKVFSALDIEYRATTFSHPIPCPYCRTLSAPLFRENQYKRLGIIKIEKESDSSDSK